MFIDFEGIDGSGKTTLSNILADRLRKLGYRVTHAREGGELRAPIARRLREMTRDAGLLEMSARTEFLLNVARDTQQLEEVVRPALRQGDVCITDRYLYSQLSHSGGGRGLPMAELQRTVEFAAQGLWPDLVILVDVDPELARLRKRVGKTSRDADLETSGSRKGLVGAGLSVRTREAFLEMARRDPMRWLVIENNDQALATLAERVVDAVRARLEGREPEVLTLSSGGPRWPKPNLENMEEAFYAAIDDLELREPNLALYLLSGIPGLASHRRRLGHVESAPALTAKTLGGLFDEESFALRHLLKNIAPREVLQSLGSASIPAAMALRGELFDISARNAVSGLKRNDDEAAWALRDRAFQLGELEAVLTGLAGIDTPRAWELRSLALRKGLYAAVARSLVGLATPEADELREQLLSEDRISTIKSTAGLETETCRRIRDTLFDKAPKVVLRSITGIDAPYAWRMRVAAAPLTKEALDSVDGMDAPEAWVLRERFCDRWPSTALSSLRQLSTTERGEALISQVLNANPRRISVLRNAWAAISRTRLSQRLSGRTSSAAGEQMALGELEAT